MSLRMQVSFAASAFCEPCDRTAGLLNNAVSCVHLSFFLDLLPPTEFILSEQNVARNVKKLQWPVRRKYMRI